MESKCVFGWLLLQMLMLRASFSFSTKERCPTLHTLTNGYMINYIYERSPFGHEVTFRCKDGYSIKGVSSVKCLRSRHNLLYWSDVVPLCQRTCNTNRLRNGQCIYDYSAATHGSRTCSCNGGFKMDGQPKGLCREASQSWSNNPKCTEISCSTLSNPTNGWVRVNSMTVGSVASFTCKDGYALAGRPSINCEQQGSQGIWSDQSPTCEKISCPTLANPINGQVVSDNTSVNSVALFMCNDGYRLIGSQRVTCQQNKSEAFWSSRSPTCQQISCTILSSPINGQVVYNRIVGSVASFACNDGYILNGSRSMTCQQHNTQGVWSNLPPTCQRLMVVCSSLLPPARGSLSIYNDSVIYSCETGYSLVFGNRKRTCLANRRWSSIAPYCQHVCLSAASSCRVTEECVADNRGQALCQCIPRSRCPSDFQSVCGTDGETYNNKCLLKVAGCQSNNHGLEVAAAGNCLFGGVCGTGKPRPRDGTACRAAFYRYWFNSTSGKCEQYVYGGCYEGRNSFFTVEDCQQTCIKDDVCSLDFDAGKCNFLNQTRWFFNATSQQCESFRYGGCFGNENNFLSKARCQTKCPACSCTSPLNRTQAISAKNAVVLLRIGSIRNEKNRLASYNARVVSVCTPRALGLTDEDRTTISVVESSQGVTGCLCPSFVKGKTYRVGVVRIKGQLQVQRSYYAEEASQCS